jgi:hypothetical protein
LSFRNRVVFSSLLRCFVASLFAHGFWRVSHAQLRAECALRFRCGRGQRRAGFLRPRIGSRRNRMRCEAPPPQPHMLNRVVNQVMMPARLSHVDPFLGARAAALCGAVTLHRCVPLRCIAASRLDRSAGCQPIRSAKLRCSRSLHPSRCCPRNCHSLCAQHSPRLLETICRGQRPNTSHKSAPAKVRQIATILPRSLVYFAYLPLCRVVVACRYF